MKNIYKILFLSLVTVLTTSCERDSGEYPYLDNRENTVGFTSASSTLLVEDGAANNVSIVVGATATVSGGTFSISVDESSTAVEGVDFTIEGGNEFSFESGNIVSTFSIVGLFEGAIVEGKTVVLNLASTDFAVSASSQFTLTLIQFCPIEADFTGSYTLSTVATGIYGSVVIVNGNVNVELGDTQTERKFSGAIYPDLGNFPSIDFNFSLVCGTVNVSPGQVTGVGCGGSSTTIGPAETFGSYDPTDDSSFTIVFTDDEGGASCGVAYVSEFILTKN
jgi:hypothetical protein